MPRKKHTRRVPPKPYDKISFLGLAELRRTTIDSTTDQTILTKEIARRAGIKQQAYSKIECGIVRNPSNDKVRAIAQAFGKTYDQLLSAMPTAEERRRNTEETIITHYTLHVQPEKCRHSGSVLVDRTNYIEEPFYLRNCDGFAIRGQRTPCSHGIKKGIFCSAILKQSHKWLTML